MSKVIFAKMTKERRKEFQICTKIIDDCGIKKVVKEPLFENGIGHILKMQKYSSMFKEKELCPVECTIKNNQAFFPFIDGNTLNDILLFEATRGNSTGFFQLLNKYKSMIYELGNDEKNFESSLEFENIFGEIKGLNNVLSAKNVNIDNILENIIRNDDKYVMIDYEWVFDCHVPYNFVVYRAIIALYINHGTVMNKIVSVNDLLSRLGIDDGEKEIYCLMNERFNEYVFNSTKRNDLIKDQYRKSTLNMEKHINNNSVFAQLYYDDGSGFSEEHSFKQNISLIEYADLNSFKIVWHMSLKPIIQRLRFDPINYSGFIKIINFTIINASGDQINWTMENADDWVGVENEGVFCLTDDPQIVMDVESNNISLVMVEMQILPNVNEEVRNQINELSNEVEQLYCNVERLQHHISRLKYNNTELQRYISSIVG